LVFLVLTVFFCCFAVYGGQFIGFVAFLVTVK